MSVGEQGAGAIKRGRFGMVSVPTLASRWPTPCRRVDSALAAIRELAA
jgi:hypothetical protein